MSRKELDKELDFEALQRLNADLHRAAETLSPSEIRYLVDAYYQVQEYRKALANQIRTTSQAGEPSSVFCWLFDNVERLEKNIRSALDAYTDKHPVGKWAKSVKGIGPVLSAGLLAYIDIEKAPTVGHIWRYAGLDPTVKWKKGEKRPWNASLKRLCWLIGECFVRVQNRKGDFYGHLFAQRKAIEQQKNEAREYADQAAEKLRRFNIGKDTEAYKYYSQGKLPPAHIHERAKRWTVKLFLAHWHEVAYRHHFKKDPPKPYPIAILGHADYIEPPA